VTDKEAMIRVCESLGLRRADAAGLDDPKYPMLRHDEWAVREYEGGESAVFLGGGEDDHCGGMVRFRFDAAGGVLFHEVYS
jgi:hypothetical protein